MSDTLSAFFHDLVSFWTDPQAWNSVVNYFSSPDVLNPVLEVLVGGLFSGLIGLSIGSYRERASAGFWLGFALGPIGWIIACFLDRGGPKCSQCLGAVPRGAARCQHCGQPLFTVPSKVTPNPFHQ